MKYCLLIATAWFACCGCNPYSNRVNTISVSGVVQLEGKPVENAEVAFISEEFPMAFGLTDVDGKYELSTRRYGKGASPGAYTVKIHMTMDTAEGGTHKKLVIPQVYSDKGVAAVTVNAAEGTKFDFHLVSKPPKKFPVLDDPESEQ
ncbi:hypothetical protein [Blastopirellula marina]|uniref:Carboxypeptidase regulatory-like domain-containing protein n=1 Tax=Blastopirellula marina DSM 3645 TaxID=314230 RepID=A3ZWJ7_9BACT|nr:hypothetical protein [Blastopirellula marina]EAQ79225.1 hypothetical protein DSM3645_26419 [Blastopirellula marina DSM 3645]